MPTPSPFRTLHPLNTDLSPVSNDPIECDVQNTTAKFFLNRDLEDLILARYLRLAYQTPNTQRKAWIFRSGEEYACGMDIEEWSKVDIRYRGVFQTLSKCPHFTKGLWQGGSQNCRHELITSQPNAQSQVIYALLSEIGEMIDLRRETYDGDGIFFLTPRLLGAQMEYWTGYRQKYKDAPETAGFLSLEFSPDSWTSHTILPISSTTKEQPLASALADKFKIMLGQLLLHLRYLPNPGDKLPDQEVFLIGLHGSKLHLMRAYFPGQKISSLWCRRKIPSPPSVFSSELDQVLRSVSPDTPSSTHIEDYAAEGDHFGIQLSSADGIYPLAPGGSRFYGAENMERVRQQLEDSKIKQLDHESNVRTFRVLASREYDLWNQQDFVTAVQMLVALQFYLLSGTAQCGTLQQVFQKHPYANDFSSPDSGLDVEPVRDARVRRDLHKQENYFEKEKELRREELIAQQEADGAHRRRESMRNAQYDRIGSFHDARRDWWDFVWEDEGIIFPKPTRPRGNEEMIVGNIDT
ncbi:uncharacterized protein N7443_005694 [Penicillium atrosanguineum]|uniref:uncharacterized protein n=1 Tax=Penicillium atrosanguineum TaxID=1132637 RepID=UPI0023820CA3|nr:uncharacterized protein N7443_005694 [Penicillium atrosanguineum]KAJ5300692.1 hypothetical protein N7443_005694 [Penicillium atrosanguineum]